MELRELRVTSLPGLDTPFTVMGQSGLNLVLGPNGSGKSSLCRAALGLLWPELGDQRQILTGIWQEAGSTWLAERTGGSAVNWQHDGRPSEPPPLAPARLAGVYRLGVLDLLKPAADATDRDLVAEIRRQLAGGIDTAAVGRRFEWTGKEGQGAAQALQETRRRIDALRTEQRQLVEQERSLGELRARHDEAVAAAGRHEALKLGHGLATARRELQRAREELAAFPPAMARLNPDDGERHQRLLAARERVEAELAAAEQACAEATRDREAAGLADGGPADASLALMREELAVARDLATELRGAEEEVAAAAARTEATGRQLDGFAVPPAGEAVSPELVASAISRLRDRDRQRAVRDALGRLLAREDLAREDLAREGTAADDPARLAAARDAMGDWLAAAAPVQPWSLRLLPWIAVVGLLLLGAVLQPWRTATWPGWAALGLGAGLALAWWLLRRHADRDRARRRRQAQAVVAGTGVDAPESWTRAAVDHGLRAVLDREAAAVQARLREQLRLSLQGDRDRAVSVLGEEDPAAELDAAQQLQRIAAWHAATAELAAASAGRDELAGQQQRQLLGLRERLAPWCRDADAELPAVAAAVDDLARRRDLHRDADKRLRAATAQLAAAQQRREGVATELAELLERLGLDADAAGADLADLLARLDAWNEARRRVQQQGARCDTLLAAIDDLPPERAAVAREAVDLPTAELEAAVAEASLRSADAETLLKQIVEIETRIDRERGDTQLAAAHAAEERHEAGLAAIRDTVRTHALARLLLERVTARYEAATEPPLLQRTRELFARLTVGRYELSVAVDDGDGRFRARDSASGRGLGLAELSDGTRAQLLLAARLAALPDHEHGSQPPLFLDESLTASDPVRFDAIGRAILELIGREGRQVFYLTCDPADVAAWQRLQAEAGADPAPVIDLQRVRGLAAAAPPQRLRPPRPVAVPEPTGDAAAFGAAIGAPPLDATRDLGAVHLFHLLRDDLPLLAALLRRRIERQGQLATFAAELRADGTLDPAAWRLLTARTRAMAAFLDAYAIGRGRPVPAGAISRDSGVDTTKLAEIDALATRLGGAADRLVQALEAGEVKRLQQAKKDEIADWLARAGYLDRRPVLDRDEVRRRVVRELQSAPDPGVLDWPALEPLFAAWWTAAADAGTAAT